MFIGIQKYINYLILKALSTLLWERTGPNARITDSSRIKTTVVLFEK